MNSTLAYLYARYRSHHETNQWLLMWMGVVGFIAFPLFYMLRFSGMLPPRYDDLEMRAVATLLCLFLALRKYWPARMQRFYIGYSYLTALYCLVFLLTFTTLKNHGGSFSVVNMVIGTVFVVLLADWRNAVVMLFAGYTLGLVAFWMVEPSAKFVFDFLIWMPAPALLFVAGLLSRLGEKQAEVARHRVHMSLAGSIAHEMRAPLQKIHSIFDALERDFVRIPQSQGSVAHTPDQILVMARMVKEGRDAIKLGLQSITLTLQQLKAKAFDTTGFTLISATRCVERAVYEFGYESEGQRDRVHLTTVNDFTFKGDETLLVLALFNLIKNALYYMPAYPDAVVNVTVDKCRIAVRDTGPGISPEKLSHLFEDFQSSGKIDGTGLGLAFCRRVMRAFGGDISCNSSLGDFTEFTLLFPEVPAPEIVEQTEDALQQARQLLRGRRVLVVDNEAFQRGCHRDKLAALGCERVDDACDGEQALARLRAARMEPYDLVLMDLSISILDRHEAARQIRCGMVPGHERVPLLAHCADSLLQARAKAREAGMDEFLRKPFSLPDMAFAIVRLLRDRPMRLNAETETPIAGALVLLADDSDVNRAIVRCYLEELGMEVMEARHGMGVLQLLRAGTLPDVILMDLEMPGLGGMDATRQLRAMGGVPKSLPVIALTGHSSSDDMDAARAAGMDGFLSKPVSVQALTEQLERVLRGR